MRPVVPTAASDATIDIVLATFNGAEFLQEQLASIEGQEGVNWRLIAGDDGSNDRTVEILHGFRDDHPDRVSIVPSLARRLGPAAQFSRLLGVTSARYVCFCDQDDVWLPEKLATTLRRMRKEEAQCGGGPLLVHTDLQVVDRDLSEIATSMDRFQRLGARRRTELRHLLAQNAVTGCTACVNRALIQLAAPIPATAIMHDWWFAVVAAAFGGVVFIPEALVQYRQHSRNVEGARRHGLPRRSATAHEIRAALARTYAQAQELVGRIGHAMPEDALAVASAYATTPTLGPIARRVHILRHRFFKSDPLKTLGMLVLM